MADSPRKQMEKVLAFKGPFRRQKECAQYILDHEEWLPLLRGRPAFYRDFILSIIEYRLKFDLDDTELPGIIADLTNSGKLWEILNVRKRTDVVANDAILAAWSIQSAGFSTTPETFRPVFDVVFEAGANLCEPFTMRDNDHLMHPLIVETIIQDAESADRLKKMTKSGIGDPLLALSLIDSDVTTALVIGAL